METTTQNKKDDLDDGTSTIKCSLCPKRVRRFLIGSHLKECIKAYERGDILIPPQNSTIASTFVSMIVSIPVPITIPVSIPIPIPISPAVISKSPPARLQSYKNKKKNKKQEKKKQENAFEIVLFGMKNKIEKDEKE